MKFSLYIESHSLTPQTIRKKMKCALASNEALSVRKVRRRVVITNDIRNDIRKDIKIASVIDRVRKSRRASNVNDLASAVSAFEVLNIDGELGLIATLYNSDLAVLNKQYKLLKESINTDSDRVLLNEVDNIILIDSGNVVKTVAEIQKVNTYMALI